MSSTALFSVMLADGWVGVIFFVIAIGGWILNVINQSQQANAKQQQQRRPQNPPARRDKLQSEIDEFLNQTRRGGGAPARDEAGAVREVPPARQAQPVRRPPQQTPAQRKRSKKEIWEEQTGRKGGKSQRGRPTVPQRPEPATPLDRPAVFAGGDTLSSHSVAAASPGMFSSGTLPTTDTLGNLGGAASGLRTAADTLSRRDTAAARFARLIRSPEGMRQAILIHEILSKPKALRPSR